ncbi:MAG: hypothetical protein QM764_03370 [Chitinophagaceae bacterium]
MKKPNHRNNIDQSPISITAKLSDPKMLLCLVEVLAERRFDIGYGAEKTPVGWRALETSCIEAYVNGDATLSQGAEKINSNFATSFLFTCTKAKGQEYNFNWLCSLS